MKPGELPRRVAVAVVGIPLVLGALYLGGWALGGLIALAAALGAKEFYALVRARGGRPFGVVGMVGSAGVVLLATAAPRLQDAAAPMMAGLVALTLLLLGASVWRRWPDGHPLADTASTVAGVLYTGGALAFVPLLRALPETMGVETDPMRASAFVLLPLLTTWAGDSAAFFVGHAVGRTKLAPHASPGKTVEGGLAGLVGAVAAGGLVAWWGPAGFGSAALDVPVAMALGAVLGAGAQVGDLAESVLKREAGVKDSGTLLPGHGGVLDRLDALLFAIPLAWLLLSLPGVLG